MHNKLAVCVGIHRLMSNIVRKMGNVQQDQPLMQCVMSAGRADYFGLAVNRAARFLGAACGGQVLAERGLVEEVVQYWHSLVYKWGTPCCCFVLLVALHASMLATACWVA